ncbi:MAG: THAP domain-containing protein, partial [Cyanobacteria bacterium J06649_11]
KESMTQWEKENENSKTEKAKKWVHACSRKNFTITIIKKDTYICSNHFIGGSGPTDLNPDPYSASVSDKDIDKLSKKRKAPKERESLSPRKPKRSKSDKSSNSDLENIIDEDEEEVETVHSNDMSPSTSAETELIKQCDSSTQTEPDKLAVMGRIDNVLLKNELNLVKSCENLYCNKNQNHMDMNVILKCDKK